MQYPVAIISAADTKYFPLLMGLIQSLHDQGWAQKADIHLIDVGMEPAQCEQVGPRIKSVLPGQWLFDFPGRSKTPRWVQALLSRPSLPALFPGYEIYVAIDADAWLADSRAVDLLVEGAREEGLALVPEMHPSYRGFYFKNKWPPRQNVKRCYTDGWGAPLAAALEGLPILNAGVFAARPDNAVWAKWSQRLQEGLLKTIHPLAEQCALNLALYADRIPFSMLPAWCNWICHEAVPRYNPVLKRFEEPIRPFQPISILHAGDYKFTPIKWTLPEGRTVEAGFGYTALKELQLI